MIKLLLGLLLLQQLQTAPPANPPKQTVETGVVVLQGVVNEAGRLTNIQVLQGTAPFIQPSLEALKEWEFTPAAQPAPVGVTFLYRTRTVLPDRPFEFDIPSNCCALPAHIVDPGYPVNSIGEGSVVLQLGISAVGSVERVRVVRPEPSLTGVAVQAIRRWKFTANRPSTAIVVISFLRPVLS